MAVALSIIAIASGKTSSFAATPAMWSEEDWQTFVKGIATLTPLPLSYRAGFKRLGMAYSPIP